MPEMSTLQLNGVSYDVRDPTKAPAGYGLGEMRGKTTTDFNTCILCGLYNGSNAVNGPSFANNAPYSAVFVVRGTTKIYQTMYFVGGTAQRHSNNGGSTWEPWEAINPPMVPGVEYRTTERHNGKVVYTKLIEFGALPNADYSSVNIGVNASKVIGVNGLVKSSGYTEPFPPIASATGTAQLSWWISGSALNIKTQGDMSNYTATVIIKYIND